LDLFTYTHKQAERYLNASNGDLTLAASLFFDESAGQQDATSEPDVDMAGDDSNTGSNPVPPQGTNAGRTLAGAYVPSPAPAASSSASQPAAARGQPTQRGVAGARTLRDLQSSGGGHGHAHDDDDDDDNPDDENQDFFAGGEKSGLAVQNPNQSNPRDQINNILKRARQ
jgi:UBX domain-containing protein 1